MSALQRYRDAMLASVSLVLLVLTAAWPAWIEGLTGLDPDGGNGGVEWLVVAVLSSAFVVFGLRALRTARAVSERN